MADINHWSFRNEEDYPEPNPIALETGPGYFEIRVKGQLNSHWSDWLEGMEVRLLENGEMILFGPIVDQAALMGVLNKLSWLNLNLLSVNEIKPIHKEKK